MFTQLRRAKKKGETSTDGDTDAKQKLKLKALLGALGFGKKRPVLGRCLTEQSTRMRAVVANKACSHRHCKSTTSSKLLCYVQPAGPSLASTVEQEAAVLGRTCGCETAGVRCPHPRQDSLMTQPNAVCRPCSCDGALPQCLEKPAKHARQQKAKDHGPGTPCCCPG